MADGRHGRMDLPICPTMTGTGTAGRPDCRLQAMSTQQPAPKRARRTRSSAGGGGRGNGTNAASSSLPPLPPLPPLHPLLSSNDVLATVFAYVDPSTVHSASFVSKSYRDALIPRQKNLCLSGFASASATLDNLSSPACAGPSRRYSFTSVEFLSCRDCPDGSVTDATLRSLAEDYRTYLPNLRRIDVTGCKAVSSLGIRALVKALGTKFEGLIQSRAAGMNLCKDMKVTPATIKAVAGAPNLKKLNLMLPSKCKEPTLLPLNGHANLQSLTLIFEGFTPIDLPTSLPNLETLSITACKWSYFSWAQLGNASYPRLHSLTIIDEHDPGGVTRPTSSNLSIPLLRSVLLRGLFGTDGGKIIIERIGRSAPLWSQTADELSIFVDDCKKLYNVTLDIRDEEFLHTY